MPKKPPLYPHVPKSRIKKKKTPSRDDVRVELWEERDRLHIGIQDKETGDYYASWWDDDARQMFEDGFFKRRPGLEESVLSYAEGMGILTAGAMEVRLWTGTRIPVSDRKEAVRVIERELEGWRQGEDRIVWYLKKETDFLPSIAYVIDSAGELTDASAIIVSIR